MKIPDSIKERLQVYIDLAAQPCQACRMAIETDEMFYGGGRYYDEVAPSAKKRYYAISDKLDTIIDSMSEPCQDAVRHYLSGKFPTMP